MLHAFVLTTLLSIFGFGLIGVGGTHHAASVAPGHAGSSRGIQDTPGQPPS
jgi:hypothetical protein